MDAVDLDLEHVRVHLEAVHHQVRVLVRRIAAGLAAKGRDAIATCARVAAAVLGPLPLRHLRPDAGEAGPERPAVWAPTPPAGAETHCGNWHRAVHRRGGRRDSLLVDWIARAVGAGASVSSDIPIHNGRPVCGVLTRWWRLRRRGRWRRGRRRRWRRRRGRRRHERVVEVRAADGEAARANAAHARPRCACRCRARAVVVAPAVLIAGLEVLEPVPCGAGVGVAAAANPWRCWRRRSWRRGRWRWRARRRRRRGR